MSSCTLNKCAFEEGKGIRQCCFLRCKEKYRGTVCCRKEINPWRKVVTNSDRIKKNKDISRATDQNS